MMLNPVEKSILTECEQPRRFEELASDLLPEFEPESIRSALSFLVRRWLIEREHGRYKRTDLGQRVLRRQGQREAAEHHRRVGLRHA
jgi:predicted transcriptional regulator